MAATKNENATKEVKVIKDTVPYDPWKDMVQVRLPKATNGELNYQIASVNGRVYKIQKGVPVSVPAPIAEVLKHSFKAQDEADMFIEKAGN